MTNKEIAKRLREICDSAEGIRLFADELDPPRPEPGTVVWFRTRPDNPWVIGVTLPYGITPANNIAACWNFDSDGVEWKPASILADDEVAVKIPPVSEWPELAVAAGWVFVEPRSNTINKPTRIITRAEAERMEADDE